MTRRSADPRRPTWPLARRRIFALAVALVASGALGACSGASEPHDRASSAGAGAGVAARTEPDIGTAVARVGRYSLTPSAVAHWTRVEAALAYRYDPTSPVPRGVVPDPPSYAACAAYLAARQRASGRRPTRGALRRECAALEQALRHHVLEILLTDYWVAEEARILGIRASAAEVQRALAATFASTAELERFLRYTGARLADERFLIESQLLLARLQARVRPVRLGGGRETAQMASEIDAADGRLARAMKRKWVPQTDCRAGYVVVECRQHERPASAGTSGQ